MSKTRTIIVFGTLISSSFLSAGISHAENAHIDENQSREVFSLVNEQRRNNGLPELSWSQYLKEYSDKVSLNNSTDPGSAQHSDYPYGENIYHSSRSQSSQHIVDSWMESEEHKDNILDEDYNCSSVSVARNNRGNTDVTQMFDMC